MTIVLGKKTELGPGVTSYAFEIEPDDHDAEIYQRGRKLEDKMMATRKVDKMRPYRVDYFDVSEMQGDKALVRSVVVRAVTAVQAHNLVVYEGDTFHEGRFVIRSYRFYKKLSKQPRFKSYVAVEKLFPGETAVEIMELIEGYRSGTGPNSPATIAVIKDLNGMISNDAHEQTMDTFVPTPQGTPEPMPGISVPESGVPCPNCGLGIDDNGDGDCAVCSSPTYKMAALEPPPPVYDYEYCSQRQVGVAACQVSSASSRVCEHGVAGCDVIHAGVTKSVGTVLKLLIAAGAIGVVTAVAMYLFHLSRVAH